MQPAEPTPTFAERAERHCDGLAPAHRKRHGVWFTPPSLALPTAARTLAPLLAAPGAKGLRIVDPAVGGGAFLRAALAVLIDAGHAPADAVRQLHGLDVDAVAADLAARALAEAANAPELAPTIAANVRHGDGLVELTPGTFDAVLTNPPWETLQSAAEARIRVAELRPRFSHQGRGKLFTYRLFVERAFQLLRPGGRLGLVVPASLWFDRDAEPLRRLLLEQCAWEWLYGFENRRKLFAIDSRYRFGVLIATKGARTTSVRVAFGRTEVADWQAPSPPHVVYRSRDLRELSPGSGAFVEVASPEDLAILQRMHRHGLPMLGPDGVFAWRQGDFNMTADRGTFVPYEVAAADGYRCGPDGVCRRDGAPDLLPLLQGAMLGELHPNAGAHAGGTGHATSWRTPQPADELRPAYLVPAGPWRAAAAGRCPVRLVHRALSNATNERTMVACLVADRPAGNSLGVLTPRLPTPMPLRLLGAHAAVLASLAFDWALRVRLGGTNLNAFVLGDCVVPDLADAAATALARLAVQLVTIVPWQHELLRRARDEGWGDDLHPATDPERRRALQTRIDLLVGEAYGLGRDDIAWIARDCDRAALPRRRGDAPALPAKGFWRVDRSLPPPLRRPCRWLAAAQLPTDT